MVVNLLFFKKITGKLVVTGQTEHNSISDAMVSWHGTGPCYVCTTAVIIILYFFRNIN